MDLPQKNEKPEKALVVFEGDKESFENFIKSLLGKPQTISNNISGRFEINANDIQNIYHLINQRIKQQNEGTLIQFKAKYIYSDNSSILLSSIEELTSYVEIKPVYVRSLHLSFQYLIKFNDKNSPEIQEIDISFISSNELTPFFDSDVPLFFSRKSGLINFTIKHTARTWGSDIESLLSNHFKSFLQQENKTLKFLKNHKGKISFVSVLLLILSIIGGTYFTTQKFAEISKIKFENSFKNLSGEQIEIINQKLSVISDFLANGVWAKHYFYVIIWTLIMLIISIAIGVWMESSLDQEEPSFILINDFSQKNKQKSLFEIRKKWFSFIGALIAELGLGVLGNYLFKIFLE